MVSELPDAVLSELGEKPQARTMDKNYFLKNFLHHTITSDSLIKTEIND